MKRFDASFKLLLEKYPADWLHFLGEKLGFSSQGQVEVMDSDPATVDAAADKILYVKAARPWLLHLEIQASHHNRLAGRMLLYNVLLNHRHRLPVRSVLLLLRPEADRSSLTGRLRHQGPEADIYLDFHYHVIRLWQQPADLFLHGGLGLLPLAPLADASSRGVESIIREMRERVEQAKPEEVRNLWTSTYVLLGLQYPREFAAHLLRGIHIMKESTTYQAIIEEGLEQGREQGLEQGRIQGTIDLLLELGTSQFDEPSAGVRRELQAITDLDYLKLLGRRIFEVSTWQELLNTPAPRKSKSRTKKK